MAANDTAADSLTTFGASDAADDMEDLQVSRDCKRGSCAVVCFVSNTPQSDGGNHDSFDIVHVAELMCGGESSPVARAGK